MKGTGNAHEAFTDSLDAGGYREPMPQVLSSRQFATLAAVCESLLPSIQVDDDPEGLFALGAVQAGTAGRAADLIGALRDPGDARRLRFLLTALDTPWAGLFLAGKFAGFRALPPAARERALSRLAFSRLPPLRAGFQALKRLGHVAHYCWPVVNGGAPTHPAWRAVGYPGPLPPPAHPPLPVSARRVETDMVIDADVVVVGSGAGGGVAAGVLAEGGRHVVVLERGINPAPEDLTQIEGDMLGRLYLDGGLMMTQSGSIPILAGGCLGGGTAINYTTSFPLPPETRAEWDEISGLRLFSSPRFGDSLDRVMRQLRVGTTWSTPGERDQLLERGCRALGWHVGVIPRNVSGCCEGVECGYCGYGCRHGAKNSTARTYLADAARRGADIIVGAEAERILIERRQVRGVAVRARGENGAEHRLVVRAPVVVVACGSINTPALLLRSGLRGPRIGRGLRLHPASAVAGVFPHRVEPWTGSLQTRYSDQFASIDQGYGVKFETAPVHFALPASGFGWESSRRHREDIGRLGHTSIIGLLLRDRDPGRVTIGPHGGPRVHYELSRFDEAHIRRAIVGGAQALAAAGATEIFSLHTPPVRGRPGTPGWLDRFGREADSRGYRRCRMSYISFHQMATAAMGATPLLGAVDEAGESFEVGGLYVADAAGFPTSSGVNPMITIMALADHVARGILETS